MEAWKPKTEEEYDALAFKVYKIIHEEQNGWFRIAMNDVTRYMDMANIEQPDRIFVWKVLAEKGIFRVE